ncbi:MAG TPA: toll/interleukin-1 receptor domain-containing protein [Thermoanaerobaculia bacterium]
MTLDLLHSRNEKTRTPYRVFISYSRADRELVGRIANIVEDLGLTPLWDNRLEAGSSFSDQIRRYIAHAHLFLPVITKASEKRNWVQQEIGYAVALSVPIIPVTWGVSAGEMLRDLQAIEIRSDIEELRDRLSWTIVDANVQRYGLGCRALYRCAAYAKDRAEMMAAHCNDVISLGYTAEVRQKGGLSSFHLPDKHVNHDDWRMRCGGLRDDPDLNRLQREERIALEKHARAKGCKLIVAPDLPFEQWGPKARLSRLRSLIEFLRSISDDKCMVAIRPAAGLSESVTILGDWFVAESVLGETGRGYRQTIFGRHAPTILSRVREFDEQFEDLISKRGWRAEESRRAAIDEMETIVSGLLP